MNTPTVKYIFFALFAFLTFQANAANYTSRQAGNYNDPCTWHASCSGNIPGSSDNISLGHDVVFNGTPTFNNMIINANMTIGEQFTMNGKLTIDASVTFTSSFTVGGDLEVYASRTLTLTGASVYVYVAGDVQINNSSRFLLNSSAGLRVQGIFCSDNSGNNSVDGDGTGRVIVMGCFQNGNSCNGTGNVNNVFDDVIWCTGYNSTPSGCRVESGSGASGGCALNVLLPVTFSDFASDFDLAKNAMRLKWETRSELNNSHFVLDRSEDGQLFVPIGEVKGQGAGDFQGRFGYVFLDKNANLPLYYYRLRQIDINGKEGGQAPVIVGRKPGYEAGFINKLHDDGTFTFELLDKNQSIRQMLIYNLSGMKAASMEFGAAGNTKAVDFDFGGMEAGIYVVKMLTEAGAYSQKIMVGQ